MKNKFTKKHKNVLIIKGTQGMAQLSLAVVFGLINKLLSSTKQLKSSAPCARMLSFFVVLFYQSKAYSTSCARALSRLWFSTYKGYRASSTSCARALSLLGVFIISASLFMGTLSLSGKPATAATSNTLNFQGRLLSNTGALVPDGNYHMEFKLYYVSSGGTAQWTETRSTGNLVSVQNGYYSIYLGDVTAFPGGIDWSQDLYLGMNIGGSGGSASWDGEMSPRFKLTSVPYAFRAANVASSSTNAASSNSDDVTITSGNALGATSNSGDISIDVGTATGTTGTISLGATNASSVLIGNAGVDTNVQGSLTVDQLATFDGGLKISDGSGNYGTIAVQSTSGDYTYTIPTTTANDTFCLASLNNCAGSGDIVQNGNSFATALTIGTNDTYDLNFETNGTTRITVDDTTGNVNFTGSVVLAASQSLTVTGGNTASRPASPTEGMVYYDTTTKQLLTYANGKWQADRSTATKIVAASNSSQAIKDAADYIATGTGDQSTINTAISAAGSGGRVYLATGTYYVNDSIDLLSSMTLIGSGEGTEIQFSNLSGVSKTMILSSTQYPTHLIVRDIKVNGRKDLNASGTQNGIELHATISRVDTVIATNFRGDGIIISTTADGSVTNSSSSSNTRYGYTVGSNNVKVSYINNTASSNTDCGFTVGGADSILSGNQSVSNSCGFRIYQAFTGKHVLTSNIARSNTGEGFYIAQSNHLSMTGNHSDSNAMGIYIASMNGGTIDGNTFSANTTYGANITASTNVVFSNNEVYDTGGASNNNGIFLNSGADNTIVSGNRIYDSSCTTTCYAININDANTDNAYLENNTFNAAGSTATIRDIGTNTTYVSQATSQNGLDIRYRQTDSTTAFAVQNALGVSILNVDTANGEVELGNTSTAGKLVVSDGSSNTVTLVATSTSGDYILSIPTLTANDTICVQTLNNCGILSSSLSDNIANALDIQEGTNNYFNINTTNSSENISFGNATTNPSYSFLGSGTLTVAGATTVTGLTTLNGGLTVEAGDTFTFNSDAFTDLTGAGLVVSSNALTLDITSATGAFINGGNSFAGAATFGTNDAYGLSIETGGNTQVTIADGGATTFQNSADSTSALRVMASAGVQVFGVDTQNRWLNVGQANSVLGRMIFYGDTGGNDITLVGQTAPAGNRTITLPDATGTICLQSSTSCGFTVSSLTDNTTDALDIQEGTNNYFNINTTDSSEEIQFGNTTTNPEYTFLGSGILSVEGLIDAQDSLTVGVDLTVMGNTSLNGATAASITTSGTSATSLQAATFVEDPTSTPVGYVGVEAATNILSNANAEDFSLVTSIGLTSISRMDATSTTIANLIGIQSQAGLGIATGSTATNATAFHAQNSLLSAGTITNGYGLFVENQTSATNDYGIYVAGADTYALWVDTGATRLDGTLEVQGTTVLGNTTSDTVTFNGYVGSSILPSTNDTYDLGSDGQRWRDIYLGGETIHLGTSTADEAAFSYTTSTNVLGIQSTGGIAFSAGSSADYVFNNDSDSNLQVTSTTAIGVDAVAVTDSGVGTTTNGVDGMSITFTQADDADATDTNSLLNLQATSSSGDADSLVGINIANITGGASAERAIQVGSGWDTDIQFADSSPIISVANGGTLYLQDGVGNNLLTVADAGSTSSVGIAGSVVLGTVSSVAGSLEIYDSNGQKATITVSDLAADRALTIPVATGSDTFCLQTLANCIGSSSSLQAAYNADVDGSDTIVALTTADDSVIFRNPAASGTDSAYVLTVDQLSTGAKGGLDIQSAGSGNLIKVTDTTTTSTDVFTIADTGTTTFKNQTNNTSAFEIQNSSGADIFGVDTYTTTDGRIRIGDSDFTGFYNTTYVPQNLLVSGTYAGGGASDTPAVAGAAFEFRVSGEDTDPNFRAGVVVDIGFDPTANSQTLTDEKGLIVTTRNNYPGAYTGATVTTQHGIWLRNDTSANATTTTSYGIFLESPSVGGTLTNYYGLYVSDSSSGSTSGANYAVYASGDVYIDEVVQLGSQTVTLTDDGVANDTVTVTASYIKLEADETGNAGTPAVLLSESGAQDGDLLFIHGTESDGSHVGWSMADTTGQQEIIAGLSGGAMGYVDNYTFMYVVDRWVQIAYMDHNN